ncbi:GNAT family N-acetyltransferase [Priestia koreensis]|uniref:GNAT family N-acetyltransferase n=1 Tax=Priestia koreensis TaxID=284581 RepID=UPI001F577EC3|nr:GNAT family N-acetyltransferase [Priestia koreensis]MCM3006307.1 GNAT family N-acetyltransferase [Priestia koreensis]UNL82937.1 GNAT family N-acetyltransferase [Priestia koreensis]
MSTYYLTGRVTRSLALTDTEVMSTVDLFVSMMEEATGVLKEAASYCPSVSVMKKWLHDHPVEEAGPVHVLIQRKLTRELEKVIDEAIYYMQRYNQIFLNEGHLLKALCKSNHPYWLSFVCDCEIPVERIAMRTIYARNLERSLHDLSFLERSNDIERAAYSEKEEVLSFVRENFSSKWADTVSEAFNQQVMPLFLAKNEKKIVGFAVYDTYEQRSQHFGPMGVLVSERKRGIGERLVKRCLQDMKAKGYESVIFYEAGPIEFYEKVCGAQLLPQ